MISEVKLLEDLEIGELKKKNYFVYASIDEKYLATVRAGRVDIYCLPEKKLFKSFKIKYAHEAFFFKNDYVVITNTSGSIFIYDLKTDEKVFQLLSNRKCNLIENGTFIDTDHNLIFSIVREKGADHLLKTEMKNFSSELVSNMKYRGGLSLRHINHENKIIFLENVSLDFSQRKVIIFNYITIEKREYELPMTEGVPFYCNNQFFLVEENELYATKIMDDECLIKDQLVFTAENVISDFMYLDHLNLYVILVNEDIIYFVDETFSIKTKLYFNHWNGFDIIYLKKLNQLLISNWEDLKIFNVFQNEDYQPSERELQERDSLSSTSNLTTQKKKSPQIQNKIDRDNFDEFENDDWLVELNEQIRGSVEKDPVKLDTFTNINTELQSIKKKYADKLPDLRTAAEEQVVKLEYSKGGESIHRGYYCPSLVLDLVVGGLNRGRLFKRKIPEFGDYSYEFGFDKDGKLLRIKQVNNFTTPDSHFDEEYLIYLKDIVYGLEFDYLGKLIGVSRCFYDNGNLTKYERTCHDDLDYEEYIYDSNRLSEVNRFFNIVPSLKLYEEEKLHVEHDEDGNISRFITYESDGKTEQFVYHVKRSKK